MKAYTVFVIERTIPPKAIYGLKTIPIKTPMANFIELEQIKLQKTLNSLSKLEKEEPRWRNIEFVFGSLVVYVI